MPKGRVKTAPTWSKTLNNLLASSCFQLRWLFRVQFCFGFCVFSNLKGITFHSLVQSHHHLASASSGKQFYRPAPCSEKIISCVFLYSFIYLPLISLPFPERKRNLWPLLTLTMALLPPQTAIHPAPTSYLFLYQSPNKTATWALNQILVQQLHTLHGINSSGPWCFQSSCPFWSF